MRFDEIKNLSDDDLEVEIDKREKMMKQKLIGKPTLEQVHLYHLLLLMYNVASERKWQKQHQNKESNNE